MADVSVVANVKDGSVSNNGVSGGATVSTQVTSNQPINASVVTGAKGDKGDTGDQGEPGTIVAVSTTPPVSPQVGDLWVDIS